MPPVSSTLFRTRDGTPVPAVTAEQMREVDRIAMEVFGLDILQMMENAGRNLAQNVQDLMGSGSGSGEVVVLAGAGGNGGGGLCCARHLHNRGCNVRVVLDRDADSLRGAALNQLQVLNSAGMRPLAAADVSDALRQADLVVDALIGYGLRSAPRGRAAELADLCNHYAHRVLSLDVPSGLNATTGDRPGVVVQPERTLTLALPKTGLTGIPGELYVADIGIPPAVFQPLGLFFEPFFGGRYWIPLEARGSEVS